MSIRDYKITDAQFSEKGVIAAPDTLTGTAAENKGVFDRFAREIIAPQFNAIVDEFADMEESANSWSAEEAQRVQQENARQTAEQGRVSAEETRVQSEAARVSAESQRAAAESARSAAETARANAENKRDSAEKSRMAAESGRVSAESARVTAESQRTNAESVRAQNESARISAETGRADAEADRVGAEDTRIANEAARKSAETDRASAETVRESGENARKSAETGRVSAETARANAESTRQTSETARVSAEKSRVSAETARQSAETARNVWEAYDAAKTYVPGNKVSFNGSSYVCTAATTGHAPTDTAYWLLIAQKGADGKGAGDMLASVYDPQGKKQDVFQYVDTKASAAQRAAAAYTDNKIKAIPTPDVSGRILAHNAAADAHADKFAKYLPLNGGKMTGRIFAPQPSGSFEPVIASCNVRGDEPLYGSSLQMGDTDVWLRLQPSEDLDHYVYMSEMGVMLSARNIATGSGDTFLTVNANTGTVQVNNACDIADDNDVTNKKYVDAAVNAARPAAHKVTLSTSGWNSSTKQQVVNCADVVADETAQQILPMPAAASLSAYNDAGILCTGQGAGTLTFQCETVPTAAIDVYVTITPVRFS